MDQSPVPIALPRRITQPCHSEHPQPFGCPCGAETRLEFEVGAGGVGKLGGRGPAAMTDAELVPSCPFPSVVPVCKRPMIWWQFAAPAASSTPLQRVFFIPPPGRAASHSTY